MNMEIKNFINYVSPKYNGVQYELPINEEQFQQVVALIEKAKQIKNKMNESNKRSFDLISTKMILDECCKAFKVRRFEMWFLIKELTIYLNK